MMDLEALKRLLDDTDETTPNDLLLPPVVATTPSQYHCSLGDDDVRRYLHGMSELIGTVRRSYVKHSSTPVKVDWSIAQATFKPGLRTIVGIKLVRRKLGTHLYPVALVGPWGELVFITAAAVTGVQAKNVWTDLNAAGLPTGQATIVEKAPPAADGTQTTLEDICDLLAMGGMRLPDPILAPYGDSYAEAAQHWQALVAEHSRRLAAPPAAA